jgi:hypothetical protein
MRRKRQSAKWPKLSEQTDLNKKARMTYRTLSILPAFLLLQGALIAETVSVKLNGGLEAMVINIGRSKDHRHLTVVMRLQNKSQKTAYLILVDRPMATDTMGGTFGAVEAVSGITFCNNTTVEAASCLGIPEKRAWTVPIQSFTEIDPDSDPKAGIVVNFRLLGQGDASTASFSAHVYLRLVSDPLKDETLPESTIYKQFRMMTLSFPPAQITDAE